MSTILHFERHGSRASEAGNLIMYSSWLILIVLAVNLAAAAEPFKSIYIERARIRLANLTTNQLDARVLHSITNLPAGVRDRLPGIADAGERFSSGCIREHAGHRFLTASKVSNTYLVAIEHGGIVYNWSIIGFVVNDAGKVTFEQEIEPAGVANQDQPVVPDTNRPPAAAGPGR